MPTLSARVLYISSTVIRRIHQQIATKLMKNPALSIVLEMRQTIAAIRQPAPTMARTLSSRSILRKASSIFCRKGLFFSSSALALAGARPVSMSPGPVPPWPSGFIFVVMAASGFGTNEVFRAACATAPSITGQLGGLQHRFLDS